MTGINIDITERKRAEELRASEAVLREADRQKNHFLAMLSHEPRNPLAPIRNCLYILQRAAPGGEQARRAQTVIDRQVAHMTWLIDDLLDVTRITSGKIRLQRERIDLNELAHRTVEDHRTIFARSEVRLEVLPAPAEVWVHGDRVRIAQIISNLLQNAAKFTPRRGKTTVSIESDHARGQAILTVRDTGAGIPPEMLPRLFHTFAQADSTLDRSKGGLGLGLALVKGLVEMHGGSVTAASGGPGKGAAFTIMVPLDVTAARTKPAAQPVLGGAGAGTRRRVLVIEDNDDAADSLREALEMDEHVVEVAYTGREGIEKAQAFRPDVVLCDIGLPEMDGFEVARAMRADPDLGRIPLIALSGYAQPEDVAIASEAGFDAHLAKPPSIDTLQRVLAEVEHIPSGRPSSS
jgi:CheY-like chemotaxis protein